jgi:type IX secretion system PorP/SprF family membrane protein
MKRILLVAFGVLSFSVEVSAQQDPQFTQNMFNRLATNPGYAGSNGSICGTIISREQWVGFEGNPKTNLFSADGGFRVMQKYQMGAGLTIIQDEIGPIRSLNAKAALSYHHRISQGVLAGGLEFGIFNQSINGNWKTSEGFFDGTEDSRIPNDQAGSVALDLGFGLYYYTKDLYVGLSSTHLNQPEIDESSSMANGVSSSYTFQQVRHYYVTAGYNYPITVGSAELELQPSIFAKTETISTQVDINTNVLYNNLVWAGVSYRVQDAVAFLAGVKFETIAKVPAELKPLRIGFAYDYNTSDLSDYNDGSLEFMINYCYKIQKKLKLERYKSVRFL